MSSETTENLNKSSNKRGSKKHIALALLIVAVALAALCIGAFMALKDYYALDPYAQEGQASFKTEEEIKAETRRKVAEGMFNISIASEIKFEGTGSEGVADIENVPGNIYNMRVAITDNATGDLLYVSGIIKPGQFIEKIRLKKELEPGKYESTAEFIAINPETHEEIGSTSESVTVVVEVRRDESRQGEDEQIENQQVENQQSEIQEPDDRQTADGEDDNV